MPSDQPPPAPPSGQPPTGSRPPSPTGDAPGPPGPAHPTAHGPPQGTGTGDGAPPSTDPAPNALPARSILSGFDPRSLLSAIPAVIIAGSALDRFMGAAVVGFLVLAAVVRTVHWWRFRWGFDGRVLHVHSGLLWRSRRAVDVARIQQVELERPLLHRVLGTALLRVETAADAGQTEVSLAGLEYDDAASLRERITVARRTATATTDTTPADRSTDLPGAAPRSMSTPPPPTVEVCRPSIADLVRHAVTGTSLLVVPAAIAALAQLGWETADLVGSDVEDVAGSAVGLASRLGWLIPAALLVVVGLLGAVATTLVRDWDLQLVREGDDLRLSRGLLSLRSATIPISRLQVLDYHQNWVRSLFGVGTVHLRSAGGGAHEQDRRITVPWVSRDQLSTILSLGLGRVLDDPDDLPMTGRRHPRDARRRLWFLWLRGAWLPVLLLASVAALALPDRRDEVATTTVGLLVATAVLAVPLGSAQYRRLGHEATDRVALVTGGVLGRRWIWMPLGRLQGVVARANPFQRRLGLVTVVLTPAGGANQPVEIRDVAADRAAELGAHLVAIAAGRRGPVARVGTRHGGRPGPSDGHGPPPARPRVDAPAPPTTDPPGPPLASA